MNKLKQAFTLVELIVVITILAILGTIAFISLQGYSAHARDSKRISDINNIKKSLELFSLNTGKYPLPDDGYQILYNTELLWTQGKIGDTVLTNLSRNLNTKPLDPLTAKEYTYSTINSKLEYELLSIYEGDLIGYNKILNQTHAIEADYPRVDGNYNRIFIKTNSYYLPTPSIINSELNGTDMILDQDNIKSQIITGGENIISNGTVKIQTGGLDISLLVYEGTITKDSEDIDKKALAEAIQGAYTGSVLANQGIYKIILETTDIDTLVSIIDDIALNIVSSDTGTVNYSCATQPSYTNAIFTDGTAIEVDQAWQNIDDTAPCYFMCNTDYFWDGENCVSSSLLSLPALSFYKINGMENVSVSGDDLIINNSSLIDTIGTGKPMIVSELNSGDFSLLFSSSTFFTGDGLLGFIVTDSNNIPLSPWLSEVACYSSRHILRKNYTSYTRTYGDMSNLSFSIIRTGNNVKACVSGYCASDFVVSGDIKIGVYYGHHSTAGLSNTNITKTLSNFSFTN